MIHVARQREVRSAYGGLPIAPCSLDASAWAVVNGTGWTVATDPTGLLSISCDNSGARDTTSMTLSGLVLVYRQPLALNLFDASPAYIMEAHLSSDEPDLTGLGIGVGFVDSTTAPTRWGGRISRRDGSGTVTKRDESNLQSNSVGTGLARLDTVCVGHTPLSSAVAQTRLWDIAAGSSTITATNAQGRTNAFLQLDNGSSTSPVYMAIFATVTVASAGTVLVRRAGFHRRATQIVGTPIHMAGL